MSIEIAKKLADYIVRTKDPEMREKMIKMYHETHNKIINDPKYQKALRERQAQDGF